MDSTPTVKYTKNTRQNTNSHVEEWCFPIYRSLTVMSQCNFILSQS